MKKIFSFFAAVLFAGSMMAQGAKVTLDFSDAGWGFPKDKVTTATNYTNGGYTITVGAAASGHNLSGTALLFGKSGATVTLPAMSFNVSKIVVKGNSNASGKVTFNIFVGETAVSTEAKGSTADHDFMIAEASQAAGTIYVIKVTNANNCQITAVEFYEAVAGAPSISATPNTWNFGAREQADGHFVEKTIKIQGANLTGEIALNFMGALFSVVPNRITPDASGNIDADVTIKSALGWTGKESYDLHASSLDATPDFEEKTILTASINVVAPVTNCATASTAALAVSGNNVPFGDGSDYTVRGYVTEIAKVWDSTNKYISFWIADAKDGGKVIQAYHAACETEAEAPKVGDLVDVTGKLTRFNKTPEFAEGCTFKIVSTPTAIDNTEAGVKANKVLRDGVLLIEKNGVLYNAQGAVVR